MVRKFKNEEAVPYPLMFSFIFPFSYLRPPRPPFSIYARFPYQNRDKAQQKLNPEEPNEMVLERIYPLWAGTEQRKCLLRTRLSTNIDVRGAQQKVLVPSYKKSGVKSLYIVCCKLKLSCRSSFCKKASCFASLHRFEERGQFSR